MSEDQASYRSGDPRYCKRLSVAFWSVCAGSGVAATAYIVSRVSRAGEDSWFPMGRALDFLHGALPGLVYDSLFFSSHIKFQYPPSGLLLLDGLRWLGFHTATEYNAINAAILIATGLLFAVFAVRVIGPIRWLGLRLPVGPIAFIVAVLFYPNNVAFRLGQMQILLGMLFLAACLALWNERRFAAGCLIAAAASVKPQFAMFGLLALWQRDWRFLAGFVAVIGIATILSIGMYGWETHLNYLKVVSFLSQHGEYHHLNQSINGIFNRLLYDGPSVDQDSENPVPNSGFPPKIMEVYIATTLSSLVMIAIPFIIQIKCTDRLCALLAFCSASIFFTMASPIAWVHHYNILLPAYVVALAVILTRRQRWIAFTLLGLSFALTALPLMPPFDPTVPSLNWAQSHVFIGASILEVLLVVELFGYQRDRKHETNPSNSRKELSA